MTQYTPTAFGVNNYFKNNEERMSSGTIPQRTEARNTIKKRRKRNYVNNPDLHQAMIDYLELRRRANSPEPIPRVPDYIGVAIMNISNRLATRGNFSNYPFKEDMISDGIETAIRYIDKYNPEKYDNPLAYFTMVIWNAFIRRINIEKKQLYLKFKASIDNESMGGSFDGDTDIDTSVDLDYMNAFIENYEEAQATKKKKALDTAKIKRIREQEERDDEDEDDL